MTQNLYIVTIWKSVEAVARGIVAGEQSTDYKFVIAQDLDEASKKCSDYLKHVKYSWNKPPYIRELTAGRDISLEKRIEILREIFPIIE